MTAKLATIKKAAIRAVWSYSRQSVTDRFGEAENQKNNAGTGISKPSIIATNTSE